jgi:PAS domain S-box-containing protein
MSGIAEAPGDPTADDRVAAADTELGRARAQIAALEQLLAVHEQISLEQSLTLEHAFQRLRLALDAGLMGTWEWDIEHGRIVWSAEQERLYGLAPGTFSGSMDDYRSLIHPEDRETSLRIVREALDRRAETHHVVHRIIRTDGATRWLDSHARFIYGDDGEPLRLVGVSSDVTERVDIQAARDRALAQAKAERERLYEVFMQAPAAITVLEGPDHVFTVINPRYSVLVGGRDLLGKPIRAAMPELEGQGLFDLLDRVYATGEPFAASEMLVKLDRNKGGAIEDLYVDFVYQPMKDADGNSFGILVHAVETTERVRARQQIEQKAEELERLTRELERSNRELDQFAYVASHDLKAPLRGIANLTEWIEEDLGERVTGESREHMDLLKGRVRRMEGLIDGILAYSRAGRVREKPELVDVGKLLADTIELLAAPAETTIVVAPDMPVVEAERVPLQQVFMNLIGNAIKHNRNPGARIDVGAQRRGACYEFSVADNGPGIPAQYHEKIWQIFQTLAPRDKVEGTGIGLSVVRKIVDARGGRAWLESQPGIGTTFYFTWPERTRSTT